MGRKKSRPIRSGGISRTTVASTSGTKSNEENDVSNESMMNEDNNCEHSDSRKPFIIEVDRSHWNSNEHFDIAEVVLSNVNFADEMTQTRLIEENYKESNFSLRFSLFGVEAGSFKLGHWPILPADSIIVEYFVLETPNPSSEYSRRCTILFSGTFDGPDEGVSGLIHLVSQKFFTLRLVSEVGELGNFSSLRVRIEIIRSAFDVCESLLDIARQPWRKSMVNAMAWLRPEVTTSEAIYRINRSDVGVHDGHAETSGNSGSRKHAGFDVAGFYEAIKPSKDEPMLEDELPDLLPQLRPYQRRAAYWMVQREKGVTEAASVTEQDQLSAPFCVPVTFLERSSSMFYNPFNGSISLYPESCSLYVSGGILADEMGLGKTVELLSCIFSHRRLPLQDSVIPDDNSLGTKIQIKRQKRDRVECVCGAASENHRYKGLWVQCDICDAWQHADCVGYSPKDKPLVSHEVYKRRGSQKVLPIKSEYRTTKQGSNIVVEMDGSYICSLCSELMEAAKTKISTAATLIVCPPPILTQWHSEISRHTRPGSLKICIYEGARNLTSSDTLGNEINELASADIVLTTYDVLKEDLSHDSDRHDGDRRFMRFQKRYPVVPTLLTRIHWWRLCLDEAQMVECNTASVTEMAMRLHAQHRWCITGTPIQRKLDDMYGLMRFLRAKPFDIYRWWVEVVRDPYENRNVAAIQFIHKFFKQIMWRSSKLHVSEELQLPSQEECLSWLTLSPIEEHFYKKQHETCTEYAHEIIRNCKNEIHQRKSLPGSDASCNESLSHNVVEKLLFPLLKLRQACCHPQVGSSGLCSLQHSPLTMEEILEVLISKTKTEGEEALRRIVVALNGLAGFAFIEQSYQQSVAFYKEALALADENSNNFRLDPLLSLHAHHNLAETLPLTSGFLLQCPLMEEHSSKNSENSKAKGSGKYTLYYVKRRKLSEDSKSGSTASDKSLEQLGKLDSISHMPTIGGSGETTDSDSQNQVFSRCYACACLKKSCETIKQKYLSSFVSKLSMAQQEFRNSYAQVCSMSKECQNESIAWWLHALDFIEQNKDSSEELLQKIDQAVLSAATGSRSLKISSRIRSISGLKYTIQNGLDSLATSRQALLDRIMEIDQTMEKPKDGDCERKRYCSNCNSGNGSLCIHCELDQMFQVYEAGLFLLKKANSGALVSSEEAIEMQKQKAALNRFFRDSEASTKGHAGDDKSKQRSVRGSIQVSKSPSPLEITLGVIKSYSKAILGRQGLASARKHLLLFEAMRKEYAHARSLSVAQSQLLGAHDEIKMSITRIRLKETQDEPSSLTVMGINEVRLFYMHYSSDKFVSLQSLARIKGQLRYLKGLVLSNQKTEHEQLPSNPLETTDPEKSPLKTEESECPSKTGNEPCPICHEDLCNPRMMFPCGHAICCKCCLQMTERAVVHFGKCQRKWIMCPTCRQHTDTKHIAYVDEKKNNCARPRTSYAFQAHEVPESFIAVHGSYGTKIEAVTRRIMWIASTDEEAKILVFSSWNDVLDVLEHALAANGVSHVRMKGGRKSQVAIARFKGQTSSMQGVKMEELSDSKPIRVLLILIQHGANGLNILEAQHVILTEPLLNPAAEAQAIGRVHRIGQEKKTFVHRFIVKNTVEESIYKLNRSRSTSMSSISGTKAKHDNRPVLTIRDVEALFPTAVQADHLAEDTEVPTGSFSHLPPDVAAGLAAERRLMESQNNHT